MTVSLELGNSVNLVDSSVISNISSIDGLVSKCVGRRK